MSLTDIVCQPINGRGVKNYKREAVLDIASDLQQLWHTLFC